MGLDQFWGSQLSDSTIIEKLRTATQQFPSALTRLGFVPFVVLSQGVSSWFRKSWISIPFANRTPALKPLRRLASDDDDVYILFDVVVKHSVRKQNQTTKRTAHSQKN